MVSKRDWLETGFAVLRQDGARALTVERLCSELDLTKGSFYHHFKGIAGFRTDLLAHFEAEHTSRFIAEAEKAGASARQRLQHLRDLVLDDKSGSDEVEIAIRSWALQDPEVHALQERVDRSRIDYLRTLWHELGGPEAEVEPMAKLLYLVLVGAQQVVPPIPASDLRDVYTLALRLAPPDREHSG
ncbi:TetR/AcrR family transcriptional regulator [Streptomyces sp. NPDC090022]|uniref:TetR/AcrR family transcriptional regulator n=1 Tax=Streptomyces sp. NPDC090022 TaxID=3365920 RepID=UPI003811FA34